MKHTVLTATLLLHAALLLGQTTATQQAISLQDSTWANLFSNDEKAMGFVHQILELEGLPDTILGNTYNHLAIHHGLRYRNDSARHNFERAVELMAGAPKRQSIIARNLGLILKDLGEYDAAREAFEQALEIHESLNDSRQIGLDYCALGNLHYSAHEVKDAITAFNRGLERFNLDDERDRISYWIEQANLGFIYEDAGQFAFAEDLFRSSAVGLRAAGREVQANQVLTNLVDALLFQGKNEEAHSVLDTVFATTSVPSNTLIVHRARAHLAQGDVDGALDILEPMFPESFTEYYNAGYYVCTLLEALIEQGRPREAIRIAQRIQGTHPEIYNEYGTTLVSVGTWERIAKAALPEATDEDRQIAQMLDTLVQLAFQRLDDRAGIMQGQFELEYLRLEQASLAERNQFLEAEAEAGRKRSTSLVIGLVVLAVAFALVIVVARLRNQLHAADAESNRQASELHQRNAQLAALKAEQLTEEIRIKESELVSNAMEYAAFQKKIETALEALAAKGVPAADLTPLQRVDAEAQFFKHFQLRFQGIHPDFDEQLGARFPDLTLNDIEFCQLLKLKLSHREIAGLLNISSSSVMTRKYRLRKRMGLEEGDRIEDHLP